VPHATRWYILILQVTTSAIMQIALSAKNRSQIQNTGATEGLTLDMKMMFLWGKIWRASARICVNDQSNSKLYSHYNMVAEIFSQALWRTGFVDARISCISSFWPLNASISQFIGQKLMRWWPYVPLWPIFMKNCEVVLSE